MSDETYDYALVGGGLQNGLIALAVRAHQPTARIALIERGATVGGNHTWCFHAQSLLDHSWINPLITVLWPGYQVAFEDYERRLDAPYACVTSPHLAREVARALDRPGCALYMNAAAVAITPSSVEVELGSVTRTIRARAVIDARGPDRCAGSGGWQKFLGRELELAEPHGRALPMLMDARVPQRDGFRFVYTLPLSPRRLLVEDTYFSDSSHLDVAALRDEIAQYVQTSGWTVTRVVREETGILPMPLSVPTLSTAPPLIAGYAGGWFHPTTAYSFPIAARLAAHVATRPPDRLYGAELDALAREHRAQLRFATRLNRMLFRWFPPDERHHVLERFYRLPEAVVSRFYSLELTALDRARILVGRPPRGMSYLAALGVER